MGDRVDEIVAQWADVRPGVDVSAMEVVGRLSVLARTVERELAVTFAEHDLQSGEFDILATLTRADPAGEGLTAGDLAASAMVTSGAITNRLDRLVAKGLVTRETDPASRRSIRVGLTDRGRRVLDAALIDHVANEERLLEPLSATERKHLQRLLRKLLAARE